MTLFTLPVVILADMVLMPHMTLPVMLPQGKAQQAVLHSWASDRRVLLVFVPAAEFEQYQEGQATSLPPLGVLATVNEVAAPDGQQIRVVIQGFQRAQVEATVQGQPFFTAVCRALPEQEPQTDEAARIIVASRQTLIEIVGLPYGEIPPEALQFMLSIGLPGYLADVVTWTPAFSFVDRLSVLYTLDPLARLRYAALVLERYLEWLRTQARVLQELPVVVVAGVAIFPGWRQWLRTSAGRSQAALAYAWASARIVVVTPVREEEIDGYRSAQIRELPGLGIIAALQRLKEHPDGTADIELLGVSRASVGAVLQQQPFVRARCIALAEAEVDPSQAAALLGTARRQITAIALRDGAIPREVLRGLCDLPQPGALADAVAGSGWFAVPHDEQRELLSTLDPVERLRRAGAILSKLIGPSPAMEPRTSPAPDRRIDPAPLAAGTDSEPTFVHDLRERLAIHRRSLSHLLKQHALHGSAFVPLPVFHGIRESRAEIARLKAELRAAGAYVDDHPDDQG